jgi:type IV pilus assembly protein PilE
MQNNHAFTLIELLIVLIIIGVLVAISYPAYTSHIIKTHRAQAKIALLDLAAQLEEYHGQHHSYKGATLATLNIKNHTENNYYQLTLQTNDNDYTVSAIPVGTQAQDKICGRFIYDQSGKKSFTGNGTAQECW